MKTNSQNEKKKNTLKANTKNDAGGKGKEKVIYNEKKTKENNVDETSKVDSNNINNNGNAINDNNNNDNHNDEGGLEEYLKRQQEQNKSSGLLLTEYKPEFQPTTINNNNNKDELAPISENILENTNPLSLNAKPPQLKPSPTNISNIISSSDMPLFIQDPHPKQVESNIEEPPFDNKSLPKEPSLQLTELSPDPK
jgi:hypothetical protein